MKKERSCDVQGNSSPVDNFPFLLYGTSSFLSLSSSAEHRACWKKRSRRKTPDSRPPLRARHCATRTLATRALSPRRTEDERRASYAPASPRAMTATSPAVTIVADGRVDERETKTPAETRHARESASSDDDGGDAESESESESEFEDDVRASSGDANACV